MRMLLLPLVTLALIVVPAGLGAQPTAPAQLTEVASAERIEMHDPTVRAPDGGPFRWLRRPTGEQLARAVPAAAIRANLDGEMLLECDVTLEGRMSNCWVVSESPPGLGYGEAGLSLMRYMRATRPMRNGEPLSGAFVRIPITMRMPR